MDKTAIIITGSSGEIGKNLINFFKKHSSSHIICIDLHNDDYQEKGIEFIQGNILDKELLNRVNNKYRIKEIYHLAAILSSKAELNPKLAQKVNIYGTLNMYDLALAQNIKYKFKVKFFFPSSIAVYGVDSKRNKKINENILCNPQTIYGQHKLYCENMGISYDQYGNEGDNKIDFRSIRFPGIISANSIPSGGTSDYIPEMIHKGLSDSYYECFAHQNSLLPFIVMPDAIQAIINLMEVDKKKLTRNIYNITSFSPKISEVFAKIITINKQFKLTYKINKMRQSIIDSWPKYIDDEYAKKDWSWQPQYNFNKAFTDYLIPHLKEL